ncbi:MAG TPA: zinc-binding alcohol dehydrogenase [Chthonomonadales bacterium]|nr:zinc-binding alcohol dehydrogenase [Chthonomonadales bacterium]
MEAIALICDAQRRFTLEPVLLPEPGPDQIAVRVRWSGVSIGTEFALIRNKISWGPYPLCTGYQGVGVVEAAGDAVQGLAIGDTVYFRGCDAMQIASGQRVSCVSGTHASRVVLRPHTTHGAALLPAGAPEDAASLFVMPSVALHGVDMAQPRVGETVAVHGCGLIGLGVVAECARRGCRVIGIDVHARPLALALELGADAVIDASARDLGEAMRAVSPDGADVVFEATGIPACVDTAIALCKPGATFVWQGNYGEAPLSMRFLPAHWRQIRMVFPCDDGLQPCRQAVTRNMASGALPWGRVITHRVDHEGAPEMFARIDAGADPDIVGVVIRWSE